MIFFLKSDYKWVKRDQIDHVKQEKIAGKFLGIVLDYHFVIVGQNSEF